MTGLASETQQFCCCRVQQLGIGSFGGEDGSSEEHNTYQALMQVGCMIQLLLLRTRNDSVIGHVLVSFLCVSALLHLCAEYC